MPSKEIVPNIHSQTRIGHIHLTVSDLDRSLHFYRDILGFRITTWWEDKTAVFLAANDYHHHIALNVWSGRGIGPQPKDRAGLYHFAILLPNKQELSKVVKRVIAAGYSVKAQDHGVSESVYLEDPDGIGIELYIDHPKNDWYRADGSLELYAKPLDIEQIVDGEEKK